MKKLFSFFMLLTFWVSTTQAQSSKYWIIFKDKDNSNYNYKNALSENAIQNRIDKGIALNQWTDVPVNSIYIKSIVQKYGVQVVCTSKWLNAVSSVLNAEQIQALKQESYVQAIVPINRNYVFTSTAIEVNPERIHVAMEQMKIQYFLAEHLDGKGVNVGVIDAGFYLAQADPFTKHLVEEGKIKVQHDFIDPERKDLITQAATRSDGHGKSVLNSLAGYNTSTRTQNGMAPNAQFFLARTENGDREHRVEEDHWVMAMEWLDSLGIKLISTSLGYAINMDDPKDNYTTDQMDGKTATITKAAQIAVDEKGIFLVNSAGNEGNNLKWLIVGAPADARGVLSIGATTESYLNKIGYSSIGPEHLPYLKPNVSCYSPNGTSFSGPSVAGFVACLMQKAPYLNNKQLFDIVQKSAHLYPYGNNFIGYGVPQADRALVLIADTNKVVTTMTQKVAKGKKVSLKNLSKEKIEVVVFYKKNETIVVRQDIMTVDNGKLVLKKEEGISHVTISLPDYTGYEIVWK